MREAVRRGEQDLVFCVICRDDSDEHISFRGQHDGKGLDAVLSSEFSVYLMPRIVVERKGAWDLNWAPQQPGSQEQSALSHLASCLHLCPVATHGPGRSLPASLSACLRAVTARPICGIQRVDTVYVVSSNLNVFRQNSQSSFCCMFHYVTSSICIHCLCPEASQFLNAQ